MARVVVGIGSNIEPERQIKACLDALQERFTELRLSRVFESEPVGLEDTRNFYNLVAAFESQASVGELNRWCKRTECDNGRTHSDARGLDIDLLLVDDMTGCIEGIELPRQEIEHHAFVLKPLAELLPDAQHPLSGLRYRELWQRFDATRQHLWPVNFIWRGRVISRAD